MGYVIPAIDAPLTDRISKKFSPCDEKTDICPGEQCFSCSDAVAFSRLALRLRVLYLEGQVTRTHG